MFAAPHCLPPLAWIPSATAWLLVWGVLAATTVVLVLLLRTRFRDVKAWKKCALLSAWVHVLLACLATNIRIGVGSASAGFGNAGPIRVAVVNVAPTTNTPATSATIIEPTFSRDAQGPPEAERAEAEPEPEIKTEPEAPPTAPEPQPEPAAEVLEIATLGPPTTAPLLPTPDLTLEAPALLPQPEPVVEAKVDKPEAAIAHEEAPEPAPESAVSRTAPGPAPVEATTQADGGESASAATVATASLPDTAGAMVDPNATPQSGIPLAYAKRFANRETTVAGDGGNPATERAVRAALAWLAASQSKDGHWDPKRFGAGQERYVLGENRGGAGARADTGITALAVLAFLGAGHSHQSGPYADNVARALDYLRREQGVNGNLGGDAELFAHMYCHSMATFAVSEACAMTRDPKLRPMVEQAVAYSLAAQHPTDGGWRYRTGDTGDTSQLGWQLMALHSAELAGVAVPRETWARVGGFLANVERGAHGGLAAYRPEGAPSRAMTAEALFCRQLLTRRPDGGLPPAALDEARRALLEEPPGGLMVNFYYWYYGTIALHRAKGHSVASDEAWATWNEALAGTLVGSQAGDGSWNATCIWGGYGGKVYATALATMCLEVYYRYTPETEGSIAHRDQWEALPAR
jgi:hypothetical protein